MIMINILKINVFRSKSLSCTFTNMWTKMNVLLLIMSISHIEMEGRLSKVMIYIHYIIINYIRIY